MIQDQNGDGNIVPSIKPVTQPLTKPGRVKMRSAAQQIEPFSLDTEAIAGNAKEALINVANSFFQKELETAESLVGPAVVRLANELKKGSDDRVKAHVKAIESGVVADIAANFQADRISLDLAFNSDSFIDELLAV
jgi:hypothetical protein